MLRPAEVTRRGVTAFGSSRNLSFGGGIGEIVAPGFVAAKPLVWAEGWGSAGRAMKNLIKNVLIGFGVGLVLVTGLSLITSSSSKAASVHAAH